MKEELIYHESQRFRQWWLIALIAIVEAPLLYGCYQQLLMGRPWGNNPTGDVELIIITIVVTLAMTSIFLIRLDVVISKEGIGYRMFPMRWSFIPWENIVSSQVTGMNMLKRYGGWGVRLGFRSKAYVISGRYTLQIRLKKGGGIVLGTRMPGELTEFLDKLNAERKQK